MTIDLEALEVLLAGARPALPWETWLDRRPDDDEPEDLDEDTYIIGANVALSLSERPLSWYPVAEDVPARAAPLIVAAVNSLPELIAEIRQLRDGENSLRRAMSLLVTSYKAHTDEWLSEATALINYEYRQGRRS